jgi:hypothetical protein
VKSARMTGLAPGRAMPREIAEVALVELAGLSKSGASMLFNNGC